MTEVSALTGTVLRVLGGFYTVLSDKGTRHTLRAQAKLRHGKLTPMVGDRVEYEMPESSDEGWLVSILPRKNSLVRPSVANIDVIVIVCAAASPSADCLLIDRMLIAANRAGIEAAVCVNKTDLSKANAEDIQNQYANAGLRVFGVCAKKGLGIEALRTFLSEKTCAFGGQSGVGKSSLINALYGLQLETGGVSVKIERGKHTTRKCELIPVDNGTRVLDTPGFSLLQTDLIEPRLLADCYNEFALTDEKCYFTPCFHHNEPDCAVKRRLENCEISRKSYDRYLLLLSEMNERWKNRYD